MFVLVESVCENNNLQDNIDMRSRQQCSTWRVWWRSKKSINLKLI